jgi:hypothetical protein
MAAVVSTTGVEAGEALIAAILTEGTGCAPRVVPRDVLGHEAVTEDLSHAGSIVGS